MSDVPVVNDYAYGFHDDAEIIFSTGKGLSEEVIRTISKEKGEPEWMLDYRLRSLKVFRDSKLPDWGPDLSALDFDEIIYYQKAMDRPARSWDDVPAPMRVPASSAVVHAWRPIEPAAAPTSSPSLTSPKPKLPENRHTSQKTPEVAQAPARAVTSTPGEWTATTARPAVTWAVAIQCRRFGSHVVLKSTHTSAPPAPR